MTEPERRPLQIDVAIERWPLRDPIRIAGHTCDSSRVVVVRLGCDGLSGRGEGSGVDANQAYSRRTLLAAGSAPRVDWPSTVGLMDAPDARYGALDPLLPRPTAQSPAGGAAGR